MAITLAAPHAARLIVEPLTPYQLALYASPDHLHRNGVPKTVEDLSRFDIVGYIDDLIYAPELRYLDEVRPGLTPHVASSSIRAQREIIAAGGGVGVLPCFLADGLVRVLPSILIERRFWLATHRDVHDTARLRTVRSWLKTLCQEQQSSLRPF